MSTQEKVSIIVPVYKVESYLRKCLDSLLLQSYKNIEIVLVNDGSPDGCPQICDEYAKKDCRVVVLHQTNQGVSAARNNGTVLATGDYVMYVDSDDFLVPYAIAEGMEIIKKTQSDMVIGGVMRTNSIETFASLDLQAEENYWEYLPSDYNCLREQYLNTKRSSQFNTIKEKGYISRAPYSRIIKADIAKKNKFPVNYPIGEDVIWNMNLLNLCQKIGVCNNIWYGYLIYETSVIRKYHGNREEQVSKYLLKLWADNEEYCKKNQIFYAHNMAIEFYCLLNFELMSPQCPMTAREKKRFAKQLLRQEPWNLLSNKEIQKKLSFKQRILIRSVNAGVWMIYLKVKK